MERHVRWAAKCCSLLATVCAILGLMSATTSHAYADPPPPGTGVNCGREGANGCSAQEQQLCVDQGTPCFATGVCKCKWQPTSPLTDPPTYACGCWPK